MYLRPGVQIYLWTVFLFLEFEIVEYHIQLKCQILMELNDAEVKFHNFKFTVQSNVGDAAFN